MARSVGDAATVAMAERALGLTFLDSDTRAALVHLRQAVEAGSVAGRRDLEGEARMSMAAALEMAGEGGHALRQADLAVGELTGVRRARAVTQRATILLRRGRWEEALHDYRQALPVLRRERDTLNVAGLLNNRAGIHSQRGDLAAAEADLLQAEALFTSLGLFARAATIRQNLGFLFSRRGDIPTALAWFARADDYLQNEGVVDPIGLRDRTDAFLAAGLLKEARTAAEEAVRLMTERHMNSYLAEARLLLSEAALLEGDVETARSQAEQAARALASQRRYVWLAVSRHALARAAWHEGERTPRLLAMTRNAASRLERAGFAVAALDCRLLAARLALDLGRKSTARRQLDLARRARRVGPADLRSRAWHAEALARLEEGNRRGAKAALLSGLRVLDRYRAALGASELRAHASGHGAELAELGLRLAHEDGDGRAVLAWVERWRAGSLDLRPVRPPGDRVLASDLAELRRVVHELGEAALAARPTDRLLARQRALEESVRRRTRQARGTGLTEPRPVPSVAELGPRLGRRALVEMYALDGRLHSVVVAGGRARLRPLGSCAEVEKEVEGLRFALRRLSLGRGSPVSLQAASAAASHAAKRLDQLLLEPLGLESVEPEGIVIVPTGALHALPWSRLPSLAGRPVTVVPSAALWHRAAAPRSGKGRVVLAAGPDLPGATAEIAGLSRRYPEATRLTGRRATVDALSHALDGAAVAHVAAHGTFRSDNPLFSSLRLADGPLTVYDLERLQRAPGLLVLSACDSGLTSVHAGDELMGLASALFSLGARTLVASLLPVPDHACRRLMLAFHGHLARGASPSAALARAQSALSQLGDPGDLAVAASFSCFGAG